MILFLAGIYIFSSNSLRPKDVQGTWYIISNADKDFDFELIQFYTKGAKVLIEDRYGFKESGHFRLRGGQVDITLESGEVFEWTVSLSEEDDQPLLYLDHHLYRKDDWTSLDFPPPYELVNIEMGRFITDEGISYAIHLHKNDKDEFQLRMGDRLAEARDIPLFLERPHSREKRMKVKLFIGKGVSLLEYESVLCYLIGKDVELVLAKDENRQYHVFKDQTQIFISDRDNHCARSLPPPPSPPWIYDRAALLSTGVEVIEINNFREKHKLENLEAGKTYLLSFDHSISFQDYISLKKRVYEIRKSSTTEIYCEID